MPNENKQCCPKCYGRQGTTAGGGVYCWDKNCPCHTPSQEENHSIHCECLKCFTEEPPKEEKEVLMGDFLEEMKRDISTPSQEEKVEYTKIAEGTPYEVTQIKQNTPSQPKWEELFDEGFVWEEAAQGMYALFRVCNEADNTTGSYDFRGSRTLAKPEYIKAFIRQLLATKIEIDEVVGMIDETIRLIGEPEGFGEVATLSKGRKDSLSSLKQKLLDLRK